MEKKLEILKLSIPGISELSARKLLGGDGYGLEEETTYTGWELPEVEVGYDRPDEWTGDPEEMMMPDDAMDYEDWYQEDFENRDENNDRDDKRNDEAPDGNDNTAQYDLATEIAKMNAILKELPISLRTLITNNNIKIVIDPELKDSEGNSKAGQYVNGVITLKFADKGNLYGELTHALQDHLGIRNDTNHTMNEFQEKLVQDITAFIDYKTEVSNSFCPHTVGLTVNGTDYGFKWESFLHEIVDNDGIVNMERWTNEISEYFIAFQSRYEGDPKYDGKYDSSYDYKWETIFQYFNIQYTPIEKKN